jgi:hypothetical protein
MKLVKSANAHQYPVRLLGISCSNLTSKHNRQFMLFEEKNEKLESAEEAALKIRKKFGKNAIKSARSLINKPKEQG